MVTEFLITTAARAIGRGARALGHDEAPAMLRPIRARLRQEQTQGQVQDMTQQEDTPDAAGGTDSEGGILASIWNAIQDG